MEKNPGSKWEKYPYNFSGCFFCENLVGVDWYQCFGRTRCIFMIIIDILSSNYSAYIYI